MSVTRAMSPRIALKVVQSPGTSHVANAPPVLIASSHTIDFTCGTCAAILMHADQEQVHNLTIRCANCGSYNSTDA